MMVWGNRLLVSLCLFVLVINIVDAQVIPVGTSSSSATAPLQGAFVQRLSNSCVPTGMAVLAATAGIIPVRSTRIASAYIVSHCNITSSSGGISVIEGVFGLINYLNSTNSTQGGSTVTITIYGSSIPYQKIINVTNSTGGITEISINYIVGARPVINASNSSGFGGITPPNPSPSGSGSTPGNGGSTGGGITPTGTGFTPQGSKTGHFVIITSINFLKPSVVNVNGQNRLVFPMEFWDPIDGNTHTGRITADGKEMDDGLQWGRTTHSVDIKHG